MNAEEFCREGDSLMERKQWKAAFARYQASAAGGCGWGMRHLAECYDNGCGTDISKAQAGEWYRRAAEQHIADSWDRAQWLEQNPEFVKMVDGLPYEPTDSELDKKRRECRQLLRSFNASGGSLDILRPLLKMDAGARIAAPFFCDYGENVLIGANTAIAQDCLILDCAPVYIGSNVTIGPGVHIYTATHPLKYAERNMGYGLSKPVHIGSNVSIGEMAVVCPGVNIGDGAVIEPHSVVWRDVAPNDRVCCRPVHIQEDPYSPDEIYRTWEGGTYSPMDSRHVELRLQASRACAAFNSSEDLDVLREFIGMEEHTYITPPFSCTYPGNIYIKQGTYINKGCCFDSSAPIVVGNKCILEPGVRLLTSAVNPANNGDRVVAPVIIGNNCWICGRAVILPGVVVGDGAVVAPGSIVAESVPPNAFVAGVPARVVDMIEQ